MERTVILNATFTLEGARDPEYTVMRRVKLLDGESLAEMAERELRATCRELHQPKKRYVEV